MKKTPNLRPFLVALTAAVLLMGCQKTESNLMQADLVTPREPQEYYTIFGNQQKILDEAFTKPATYFAPEHEVRGAVIAANLQQKEQVAGFFKSLSFHQKYQTIVVLSSTTIESAASATAKIFTTFKSFKTPYGFLVTDQNLIQIMQDQKVAVPDEKIFEKELATNTLAPFIKKTFPDAQYLPLLVHENITQEEAKNLALWLKEKLGDHTLVIARTTTQTSPDPLVAEFQFKFTENVLQNFDTSKLAELPLKNQSGLQVLFEYLHMSKAQKAQTQFMESENNTFAMLFQEGPLVSQRHLFLVSFGDIMLGRLVRTHMNKKGIDYPFEKMDPNYLKYNDLLLANLEGPIAKQMVPTSKTIAFRFLPDVAPLLKKYSFDVLSEANNHALDMGANGYTDSRDLIAEQGMMVFGDPREVNQNSVATTEIQGQKVAFLGLDDVDYKIDQQSAVDKITELKGQGYKVIPFLHWGVEYTHSPTERQQKLAHAFIDAGAALVIGCHPHVVQTFEIYNNKPIFYSLGNAIFDQYFSGDTQEGLSIALDIANDQIQIYFLPIKLPQSQMVLMNEEQRKKFLEKFVTWGDYSEAEKQQILKGYISLNVTDHN